MGRAARLKKTRKTLNGKPSRHFKHVMAEEMKHLWIRGDVRLWQVIGKTPKRLTGSFFLDKIEELSGWDEQEYWGTMAEKTRLANGFYMVEHSRQKGHIFLCDTYTKDFDDFLIARELGGLK